MKCDVAIVGAGISGPLSALKLAKKGYKVVVIEDREKVGTFTDTKIDITEDRGIKKIIKELDLPVILKTNKSKWFSPNYSFDLESEVYDIYFKRGPTEDSYEVNVTNSAEDEGAKILTETNIQKFTLKQKEDKYKIVVSNSGGYQDIEAEFIIGADGFNSKVGKLGKVQYGKEKVRFVGYGVVGTKFDMPIARTHLFFDRELAPGGYMYIGKTDEGEGVACIVVDSFLMKRDIKDYYQEFKRKNRTINKILSESNIENTFRGMNATGDMPSRVKRNIVLVGDAARTLDPLFGYGVKNAIISAYNASKAIMRAIDKEDRSELSGYTEAIKNINEEIILSYEMRKDLVKSSNKELDELIKTERIVDFLVD